jgi:hypothetical protein
MPILQVMLTLHIYVLSKYFIGTLQYGNIQS